MTLANRLRRTMPAPLKALSRVRCDKWLLAACCLLAATSVWQLTQLESDLADAKLRVLNAAQHQVMTYLTSNLPQAVRQWYSYLPVEIDTLNDLDQNDPSLIRHVRQRSLVPPSDRSVAYNLRKSDKPTNSTLVKTLLKIFENKTSGFFVESRALDGEEMSVTLELERNKKWDGLLIEPDPSNFQKMLATNRKCWLAPVCLSTENTPILTKVSVSGLKRGEGTVDVHCLPLASLLIALNSTVVDLLRLDLNGDELPVLETISFDSVFIAAISVKFAHGRTRKETMRNFVEGKGYTLYTVNKTIDLWSDEDYLFIKDDSGLPKM
ncbi:protein Star-like [Cloeon dipterum]|uniref:protein Star-like n=1 Tax=Cloeon dipterum TaxID=197152 RepID=UPI00321FEC8B